METTSVIIIPATITPIAIVKKDFFLSISKNHETRHPVYAPVPGKGTATKRNRSYWRRYYYNVGSFHGESGIFEIYSG